MAISTESTAGSYATIQPTIPLFGNCSLPFSDYATICVVRRLASVIQILSVEKC